jgi:antitoxin MazE
MEPEPMMQVSKWSNRLAVRLPKKLVEELKLSPGDEIEVVEASKDKLAVEKIDRKARFLKEMERFNWSMSDGWTFDRDEANER